MTTNFPTNLDDSTTIPVESAATKLSVNHVTAHQNIQDAIEAVEAKLGVDGSAVTTSHDYKLSGVTGSDKAVSKTGTETLTNKTLTTPVITSPTLNLGSDAEGDTYYRNSGGALVRLPRGTDNYIYKMNGNVPNWEAEATIGAATDTTAGIGILATAAQITAGTASESGYPLVITPDQLLSAGIKQTDIQTFTANGTWTKPSGAKSVLVQAWGGGGAGGFGDSGGNGIGGGGGGGGSYKEWTFNASDLSATETVVVGAGGTGGAGNGPTGGDSSFGTLLYAYGGGGGAGNGSNVAGGGGGGIASAGSSSTTQVGGNGGNIAGGTGGTSAVGTASSFGGGGGGAAGNTGYNGGLSIHGGGGGGGGSANTGAPSATAGVGGLSFYGGGGGAGGPSQTGTVAGGTSVYGGAGGGSQYVGSGTATAGTNGGVRGGGGGGGTEGGNGGSGGRGEVIVTTYF